MFQLLFISKEKPRSFFRCPFMTAEAWQPLMSGAFCWHWERLEVRRSRAPSEPPGGWILPWEFAWDSGLQCLVHPGREARANFFSFMYGIPRGQLLVGVGVDVWASPPPSPKWSLADLSQLKKSHDFSGWFESPSRNYVELILFASEKGQKY